MRKVLIYLALMVGVALAFLVFGQRLLVFPGAYFPIGETTELPEGAERWELDIEGGVVEAIVMDGRGTTPDRPGPAVVFFHGNGELADQWTAEMRWYAQRGYTVLLPEYRGYGDSTGKPSQTTVVRDAVEFYDRLAALPTVDADRIVFHGRSLGGGVAAQLAAQRNPRALILASTFTSVTDAALGPIPVPAFLIKDPFPVKPVLEGFDGPVLILHGELDQAVHVSHARQNADAAANSTLVIYPGINHNDMPYGHGHWDDILPFLDRNGLPWQVPR